MKGVRFSSKPDGKTILQMLSALAMAGILCYVLWWRKTALWMIPVLVLLAVHMLDVLLFTHATLYPDHLLVQSGHLSRRRIPLSKIQSVGDTAPPGSVPVQVLAVGTKRLYLTLEDGSMLCITPADTIGFITALKRRLPQLEKDEQASIATSEK